MYLFRTAALGLLGVGDGLFVHLLLGGQRDDRHTVGDEADGAVLEMNGSWRNVHVLRKEVNGKYLTATDSYSSAISGHKYRTELQVYTCLLYTSRCV